MCVCVYAFRGFGVFCGWDGRDELSATGMLDVLMLPLFVKARGCGDVPLFARLVSCLVFVTSYLYFVSIMCHSPLNTRTSGYWKPVYFRRRGGEVGGLGGM